MSPTPEWAIALAAHRRRHYDAYRMCKGLLDIVQEVGNDPGLRAGVEHLRALIVTANDRHLLTTYPEAIGHKSWSGTNNYLTPDELRRLRGEEEGEGVLGA